VISILNILKNFRLSRGITHLCDVFKICHFERDLAKPFQRHVSFYILKISKGCFVWAAPTLRTGAIIILFNYCPILLNIRGYREKWCKVLAARRIFRLNTQNIAPFIGIDATWSLGIEATLDQLVRILHFLFYYLSPKFFIFFILKYRVFFTRKKYLQNFL
jgi:hypothetical protein